MRGLRQWKWHLDVNGEFHYLWRAVDQEGEILESYVTKTRNKDAAMRFMKKALKRHGCPEVITIWRSADENVRCYASGR